jgi:hypothetical protein
VRLGRLEAYRYRNLRPRGAVEPLTSMYVTSTERGVATVACVGLPRDAPCAGIAASLALDDGVRTFPLGPVPAYAAAVDKVVDRLQRERARALADLRRARTRRGQGTAAAAAAAAYRRAAGGLARAPASPLEADEHAALRKALSAAGATYAALGRAARAGERRRYVALRDQARSRDTTARRRVAAFERLGSRVG